MARLSSNRMNTSRKRNDKAGQSIFVLYCAQYKSASLPNFSSERRCIFKQLESAVAIPLFEFSLNRSSIRHCERPRLPGISFFVGCSLRALIRPSVHWRVRVNQIEREALLTPGHSQKPMSFPSYGTFTSLLQGFDKKLPSVWAFVASTVAVKGARQADAGIVLARLIRL